MYRTLWSFVQGKELPASSTRERRFSRVIMKETKEIDVADLNDADQ